jgi:hypothetical protein
MKNYRIDFSRFTTYSIFPTRFVMKMIFKQMLVNTFMFLFIITGDYFFSGTDEPCYLFPHELQIHNLRDHNNLIKMLLKSKK